MRKLPSGTLVIDEVHGITYRLEQRLGQGGFGTAYRAVELNRNGGVKRDSDTCIKLSLHADQWHGEVYFANLLRDVGHVVEMRSAFPTSVFQGGRHRTAFAINMEWVEDGTVRDECDRGQGGWTEEQVCRRVRLLLKPFGATPQHGCLSSRRDAAQRVRRKPQGAEAR
jgi:serine/threonine protein kinase